LLQLVIKSLVSFLHSINLLKENGKRVRYNFDRINLRLRAALQPSGCILEYVRQSTKEKISEVEVLNGSDPGMEERDLIFLFRPEPIIETLMQLVCVVGRMPILLKGAFDFALCGA
jgi:hypothetical protein